MYEYEYQFDTLHSDDSDDRPFDGIHKIAKEWKFSFFVTNSNCMNIRIYWFRIGRRLHFVHIDNNKWKLKIEKWTFAKISPNEISSSRAMIFLYDLFPLHCIELNKFRSDSEKDLKMKTSIHCIPSGNLQNIHENNISSNGFLFELNRDFFPLFLLLLFVDLNEASGVQSNVVPFISSFYFSSSSSFFVTLLIERSLKRACETNFKVP